MSHGIRPWSGNAQNWAEATSTPVFQLLSKEVSVEVNFRNQNLEANAAFRPAVLRFFLVFLVHSSNQGQTFRCVLTNQSCDSSNSLQKTQVSVHSEYLCES